MEIKLRNVCKGYVAYACPRCVGGTMYWEQDKADSLPYLKCILCGEEVRQEKKFEKTEKNIPTGHKSEAKIEVEGGSEGKNEQDK